MSSSGSGSTSDRPQSTEWSECRATIGRLDTILQDLRKYGFTLIAGLLTASSYIGYGSGSPPAGVAAFAAVMCLIAGLFAVDIYYSVLQSAAVERAIDIEAAQHQTSADFKALITATMSRRATQAGAKFVILSVYVFLLVLAGALAVFSAVSSKGIAVPLTTATAVGAIVLIALTLAYWNYVGWIAHLHTWKPRGALDELLDTNLHVNAPRSWWSFGKRWQDWGGERADRKKPAVRAAAEQQTSAPPDPPTTSSRA